MRPTLLDGLACGLHHPLVPSQTLNRLRTLETAMAEMATAAARTDAAVERLAHEMREFKDESRAARIAADARAEQDRRDLNRRLGDIANHQGRLVEDIVAPSIATVLRGLLGLPEHALIAPCGPRLRLSHPLDRSRVREIDVVAAHGALALVVEVKSQLGPEQVAAFATSLPDLKEYLAPLGISEVLGAVATLHADPSIVAHASRLGLVVLGVGDELMEPKNPPGFVPARV